MHSRASACPVTGNRSSPACPILHSVSFKWLYVCERNVCERDRHFCAFTQESLVCNSLRITTGEYCLSKIVWTRSVSYFGISCTLRILRHEFDDRIVLIWNLKLEIDLKYKGFSRYFRLWVTSYVGLGILCLLHRLAWSTLREHCFPNALKSTRPKSMNFLELLCTWCNPGLSREAWQVELEVLDRGEHGHCGASIPQVGW